MTVEIPDSRCWLGRPFRPFVVSCGSSLILSLIGASEDLHRTANPLVTNADPLLQPMQQR
jgi:hypothetical protein